MAAIAQRRMVARNDQAFSFSTIPRCPDGLQSSRQPGLLCRAWHLPGDIAGTFADVGIQCDNIQKWGTQIPVHRRLADHFPIDCAGGRWYAGLRLTEVLLDGL